MLEETLAQIFWGRESTHALRGSFSSSNLSIDLLMSKSAKIKRALILSLLLRNSLSYKVCGCYNIFYEA